MYAPLTPIEHDVPQQEPGVGFFSVIKMKFVMYLPISDQIKYKNRVSNATTITRSTHEAVNGVNHCIKLERSRNLLTGCKGCLENNHPKVLLCNHYVKLQLILHGLSTDKKERFKMTTQTCSFLTTTSYRVLLNAGPRPGGPPHGPRPAAHV